MSEYGKVSIIMPSYNTARYIGDSIRSVLAQTYEDWELIIVDDCSTDDTKRVVSAFDDSRIVYLENERNSGAAISRNRALREATGRWMAFLDSDDLWLPKKLEKQLAFMAEKGYAFTGTMMREIDEGGNELRRVTGPAHVGRFGMFLYCWPSCLTVMWDTKRIGLVQIADLKKNNDYAMWVEAVKKADFHMLHEELALYRRRRGSISSASILKLVRSHFDLWYVGEGFSIVACVGLTLVNIISGVFKKAVYTKPVSAVCASGSAGTTSKEKNR